MARIDRHLRWLWMAVAVLAAAGCDPYPESNADAVPQILGVMVTDVNYNGIAINGYCSVTRELCSHNGSCNLDSTTGLPSGYCSTATLERCLVDTDCTGYCAQTQTWGCQSDSDCNGYCSTATSENCMSDTDCPSGETCSAPTLGNCSVTTDTRCRVDGDCPDGETCQGFAAAQVCIMSLQTCVTSPEQTCTLTRDFPPRVGPMFEPGYQGGPVVSPATWSLTQVPAGLWPSPKYGPFLFALPRVIFNKLMEGTNIQPDAAVCDAGSEIQVTAKIRDGSLTDVTGDFGVCYDPASPSNYDSSAMFLMPSGGVLVRDSTYHITGTVKDKEDRSVSVDLTVETAP